MKAHLPVALVAVLALLWSLGACSPSDESPRGLTPEADDAGDTAPEDISEATDVTPLSDTDDPAPDGGDVPDVDAPDAAPDVSLPTEDVAEPEPEPFILECEADADCADGLVCCQGRCADLDSDREHCGACGRACPVECGPDVCLKAVQISVGEWTTCAVLNNGTIRCWGAHVGRETEGNLGSGRPVEVVGIDDAVMVSCAEEHVCALHEGGTVSCWGWNNYFQLGQPSAEEWSSSPTPVPVVEVTGAVVVEADFHGTCAVLDDGGVMCWGLPQTFRFGGYAFEQAVRIPAQRDVVGVSMSHSHALWLHADGSVWGAGHLIRGPDTTETGPVLLPGIEGILVGAGSSHACVVEPDGALLCWAEGNIWNEVGPSCADGGFCGEPYHVPGADQVISLSLGQRSTCFANVRGEAFCMGRVGHVARNPPAISGMPLRVSDIPEPVVQVSVKLLEACALTRSGQVYCWGSDYAKPIEW